MSCILTMYMRPRNYYHNHSSFTDIWRSSVSGSFFICRHLMKFSLRFIFYLQTSDEVQSSVHSSITDIWWSSVSGSFFTYRHMMNSWSGLFSLYKHMIKFSLRFIFFIYRHMMNSPAWLLGATLTMCILLLLMSLRRLRPLGMRGQEFTSGSQSSKKNSVLILWAKLWVEIEVSTDNGQYLPCWTN